VVAARLTIACLKSEVLEPPVEVRAMKNSLGCRGREGQGEIIFGLAEAIYIYSIEL
jgi:hypothetical protein